MWRWKCAAIKTTGYPKILRLDAEAFLFQQLAKKSTAEKLRMIEQASSTMRNLAMIGLRERNPEATELELKIKFVDLLYGPVAAADVAKRLTGDHE